MSTGSRADGVTAEETFQWQEYRVLRRPCRIVLFANDQDLLGAIPELQKLRLKRMLQSVSHIGNDLRALASDAPSLRDRLPGHARLTPEVRAALRKGASIGAWSMSGAFYGTSR